MDDCGVVDAPAAVDADVGTRAAVGDTGAEVVGAVGEVDAGRVADEVAEVGVGVARTDAVDGMDAVDDGDTAPVLRTTGVVLMALCGGVEDRQRFSSPRRQYRQSPSALANQGMPIQSPIAKRDDPVPRAVTPPTISCPWTTDGRRSARAYGGPADGRRWMTPPPSCPRSTESAVCRPAPTSWP